MFLLPIKTIIIDMLNAEPPNSIVVTAETAMCPFCWDSVYEDVPLLGLMDAGGNIASRSLLENLSPESYPQRDTWLARTLPTCNHGPEVWQQFLDQASQDQSFESPPNRLASWASGLLSATLPSSPGSESNDEQLVEDMLNPSPWNSITPRASLVAQSTEQLLSFSPGFVEQTPPLPKWWESIVMSAHPGQGLEFSHSMQAIIDAQPAAATPKGVIKRLTRTGTEIEL